MNLELYKVFCRVAAAGSILKASEELYISQPAVSRSIKQLEDEIGCRLFARSSRGVRLTDQGEILYRFARQAITLLKTGEKKISEYENLESGEVIVGVSDTLCKYYLTPYLNEFNSRHPNIRIQIRCYNTPETVKLLKEGQVDIAIITSLTNEENLTLIPVLKIQDCFAAGEKYKFLAQEKRHIEEVVANPVILLTHSGNSRSFIDGYFRKNSIEFEPAFELGNFDLLAHFARNNFGIACVIKNFISDDLKNGRLFEIKLFEEIPPREVCIALMNGLEPSPAAKELIRMMSCDQVDGMAQL